ncbi:unnamed protein product [Medioppia subpectinata]|uniref:Receptor L-domain domain-containing protein n=1 Tax=Medioppia subpectinata TaxID=1979941 RepID=A0A7R9KWQ9_9ACAR|nr:unnamed protein product [Medioppia subpectinata]CAG2110936.1 unnamed protein product [Medioppia subpectinata]
MLGRNGQKQDGELCNGNYLLMNTGNDFQALANCSRVTGFVAIMKMNAAGGPPLDTVSLPKLIEISDYLLIYDIAHVRHLTNWFPNLSAIRGRKLFYGYALVIYHLPSVRHLGFPSLGHIKGGVRVERVPQLCISRESNDYRLLAKAMAKHSTEPSQSVPPYTVPNKPALDGLRVTTASADNILLEWPNGTAGANGTYRVDVRQIFDYGRDMNDAIVDKRSCHMNGAPNVLNLDEQRKCRLRADKSGQWLVFYYMGHDPHLDGFGTLITKYNFVQQLSRDINK